MLSQRDVVECLRTHRSGVRIVSVTASVVYVPDYSNNSPILNISSLTVQSAQLKNELGSSSICRVPRGKLVIAD